MFGWLRSSGRAMRLTFFCKSLDLLRLYTALGYGRYGFLADAKNYPWHGRWHWHVKTPKSRISIAGGHFSGWLMAWHDYDVHTLSVATYLLTYLLLVLPRCEEF